MTTTSADLDHDPETPTDAEQSKPRRRRLGRAVSRASWGALALFLAAFAVLEAVNHGVFALMAVVVFAVAPDVTMLIDARGGGGRPGPKAVPFHNAAHRAWGPLALLVISVAADTDPAFFAGGLGWLTHIVAGRAFGHGLRAADGSRRGRGAPGAGCADRRRSPRVAGTRRRRILTASALLATALIGYTTWTNARPYTLQASIDINASPQQVWAVLSDLPHYSEWNPFIVSSSGDLQVGATLTNKMHDATGDTTFTPTIEIVRPGQELRWIGKVGPGMIFDGEHTFTLQALGPGRTRLTQHEDFTGITVPFLTGKLKKDTFPQFQAMNTALARVAESR